jgi:hypothetical protein
LGIGLPLVAFPRGSAERESRARLAQVSELIAERKYNQAILALSELLKQNPDLFDAAEGLMQQIRDARAVYNAKFEELITALFEENNIAKGLALIDELEKLDPYPNEAVARALEQAKVGRELVVNMNRFNRIMDEAAELLGEGRYAEANARYLEGFSLGRESFDAADYGNILKNSVLGSLDSLQSAVDAFPGALDRLAAAQSALTGMLSPLDASRLVVGVGEVADAARVMAGLEAAARKAGENFQAQGRQIGERPAGRGYDSFLFFGAQLILGRSGKPREGIAAVVGLVRESAVSGRKQALLAAADALWRVGLQEYESGRYPLEQLSAAASAYAASLRLLSLWVLSLPPEAPLRLDAPAAAAVAREGAEYLLARERIRAARGYGELAGVGQAFAPWEQGSIPALERIGPARLELAVLIRRAGSLEENGAAGVKALQKQGQAAGLSLGEVPEQARALGRAAGVLRGRLETFDLRLLSAAADEALGRLTQAEAGFRARYQTALGLQQGVQTPERLEKYPGRALGEYTQLTTVLAAVTSEAERLAGEMAAKPGYLETSPSLRATAQGLDGLRAALAGFQAELARVSASAQAEILQAGRFKQEGQLRVQEVEDNRKLKRYVAARQSLQNAQEALDRSLDFQEDSEVRRLRDDTLPQLAKRINDDENTQVIIDVRALINSGRRLYSLGDYNRAEQEFLKGGNRWADTNPLANPEVDLWLDWTRSAIQNIAGREIALSNPLYPQMSQLYNLAFQEYQSGRKLVETGRVREALELLEKAVERLNSIKNLFPYNSEAQILILRIEQLRDRDRFREVLDGQFREALGKRELNPSEALNTLEVIKFLSPSYPGLQNAISALRIRLGLDLPPPDPAKKAEARRLYAEALRTFQQNQRELFPRALEQLNGAIALDPDYREAVNLKDRLQIALGGSRQPFLSSDDQRRFKEAEGFFLDGQYPSAYQIVSDLLKSKRNQGYAPLLELRTRIEARL